MDYSSNAIIDSNCWSSNEKGGCTNPKEEVFCSSKQTRFPCRHDNQVRFGARTGRVWLGRRVCDRNTGRASVLRDAARRTPALNLAHVCANLDLLPECHVCLEPPARSRWPPTLTLAIYAPTWTCCPNTVCVPWLGHLPTLHAPRCWQVARWSRWRISGKTLAQAARVISRLGWPATSCTNVYAPSLSATTPDLRKRGPRRQRLCRSPPANAGRLGVVQAASHW